MRHSVDQKNKVRWQRSKDIIDAKKLTDILEAIGRIDGASPMPK